MGNIADMIVNGEICQICMSPFLDYHAGHPRNCRNCQPNKKKQKRKRNGKQDGEIDALKGEG